MNHPDFRLAGKVIASLGPDGQWGMVRLRPSDQLAWVKKAPKVFEPFPGAWGRQGYTRVKLEAAMTSEVKEALLCAWEDAAEQG